MKKIFLLLLSAIIPMAIVAQNQGENNGPEGVPGGEDRNPVCINGINYLLDEENHEAIVSKNEWKGELYIPSAVTHEGQEYVVSSIAWYAFNGCETLTKVHIPKTLTKFYTISVNPDEWMNPFEECRNLESIEVDGDNPTLCSVDGVLLTKDRKTMCSYPIGSKRTSYEVPEGVEKIAGAVFSCSENLVSIQIPQSVDIICSSAFQKCTKLESINLPTSLKYISGWLFRGCEKLCSIDIPESVTHISDRAFYGCSSLKVLDIPENVHTIGSFAFGKSNIEQLIIRGHIYNDYLSSDIFTFMENPATLYVPSAEVDRFKPVYQHGNILPLEEYEPTSIRSAETSTMGSHSKVYNIEGQEVSQPAQRGIYIRNGKKFVVK